MPTACVDIRTYVSMYVCMYVCMYLAAIIHLFLTWPASTGACEATTLYVFLPVTMLVQLCYVKTMYLVNISAPSLVIVLVAVAPQYLLSASLAPVLLPCFSSGCCHPLTLQ